MKKNRLLVSLVVAIAATVVALRYRTLQQLKTEQTQLRQQLDEVTELRAAIAQEKSATSVSTNAAALFTTERLELLRLRNEISQLRRELATESNQMTVQWERQKTQTGPAPSR
jgi:hypothetical protein